MRSLLLILLVGLPLIPGEKKLERIWSTSPELNVPESVLYDQKRKALYVSCIDGKPSQKNGKGYLAKMTLDGKIRDQQWIKGLHAPKGMDIHNDTLYVSDVDRLIAVDLQHGNIAAKYGAKDASFLNDVTVDPKGRVFVSDMKEQSIYCLKEGEMRNWKEGEVLEKVNGLYWEKGTLYAGTHDRILAINPNDKSSTTVVEDIPAVDGLIAGVKGGFLFSDWEGRVFFAQQGKDAVVLSDTRDDGRHAADIDYRQEKQQVYVPTFFDNRVFAYKLKEEG